MRKRLDVDRAKGFGARDGDEIFAGDDFAPHGLELHECHAQKRWVNPPDRDRTAGKRASDKERSRLDAVAHHGMLARPQITEGDTVYLDGGASCTIDMGAHAREHVRQVDNLGLARRVLDERRPVRHHGRHERVLRCADARELEHHVGAMQAVRRRRVKDTVGVVEVDA